MTMQLLVAVILGGCLFFLALGLPGMVASMRGSGRARARRRLSRLGASGNGQGIERRRAMSDLPWLHRVLAPMAWASRLDAMLRQARWNMTVGVLVLVSAAAGAGAFVLTGLLGARLALNGPAWPWILGAVAGCAPLFWLRRCRNRRMAAFAAQLPEALDLVARALKAGHAFSQGLRMVADEMDDPIGPEFAETLEEINFGVPADAALHGLTRRVDCQDLKFFVVSVNIQRETGGNLAEIVSTIARLVRERFKLQGKVKVLSAEGRLSAYVLLALPLAIALVIKLINPAYMARLTDTEPGRYMLWGAAVMMCLGAAAIKRLIVIKV